MSLGCVDGDRRIAPIARLATALLTAMVLALAPAAISPAFADTPTPEQPAEELSPGRDQIESFEAERIYLDAEGFRAAFEGKTVHLQSGGRHYGSEYYLDGDRTVWIAAQEPCRPGLWSYADRRFCFQYDLDGPYCWFVFRRGDRFFAESMDGFELEIYAVEERPLTCDPELFS